MIGLNEKIPEADRKISSAPFDVSLESVNRQRPSRKQRHDLITARSHCSIAERSRIGMTNAFQRVEQMTERVLAARQRAEHRACEAKRQTRFGAALPGDGDGTERAFVVRG